MKGTVARITSEGIWVDQIPELPGQELCCDAIVHRTAAGVTEYQPGDRVRIVEDEPNEFTINGLIA